MTNSDDRSRGGGWAPMIVLALGALGAAGCSGHGHSWGGHSGTVRTLAFSPDSSLLASGGADGRAIIRDTRSGRRVGVLVPDPAHARYTAWTGATGGQGVAPNPHVVGAPVDFVGFVEAGVQLVVVSDSVVLYDAHTWKEAKRYRPADADLKVLWSPTFARPLLAPDRRHLVALWGPCGASVSDDVEWTIAVHDLRTFGPPATCTVSEAPRSWAFDSESRRLATAVGKTVKVWTLAGACGETALAADDCPPRDVFRHVAFSPTAPLLAGVDDTWCVRVWDAARGELLWWEELPREAVRGSRTATPIHYARVAFNDGGDKLAVGCGWAIVVFQALTGERLRSFPADVADPCANGDVAVALLGFWGTGGHILTKGAGGFQVWSAAGGSMLWRASPPSTRLLALDAIASVAASDDDRYVASGTASGPVQPTVRLWRVPNAELWREP